MQSPLDFARVAPKSGPPQGGESPPALPVAATPALRSGVGKPGFQMAVYRCEVKTLKRASGRSAVAATAYRAGVRVRDEQAGDGQGKVHDYRRRAPGVAYAEILAPSGAPEWATHRGQLWNHAERAENRRNSVTAREVLISLPHELDDEQRAELVRGFASRLVERYGVAVDMAVHRPDRKGDQRNHHAHLMMTTRRMTAEGLKEKTRELDDVKKRGPEEIEAIRAMWEHEQNQALERAGMVERVSRLSNAAQGIDREPEPKLGEAATALMRQGQPTRLGDLVKQVRQRNSMRYNMARQRSGALGQQKEDAIARALQAAAAQGFNTAAGSKGVQAQAVAFALQKAKEQDNTPPPPARLRRRGSGPEFDR